MPKFLLSFLFVLPVSLIGLGRTVLFSSPDQKINLIAFFAYLFMSLFSLFSIFTYFFVSIRVKETLNRKSTFRRLLFIPFFLGLAVVVAGVLKIIGGLTSFNLLLLIVLVLISFFYLSRS